MRFHRKCNMIYQKDKGSSYQNKSQLIIHLLSRWWVTGIRTVWTIHQSLYVHTNSCSLFIKWLYITDRKCSSLQPTSSQPGSTLFNRSNECKGIRAADRWKDQRKTQGGVITSNINGLVHTSLWACHGTNIYGSNFDPIFERNYIFTDLLILIPLFYSPAFNS